MAQRLNVLVDDHDSQINYLCPIKQQEVRAGAFYNKTWTTITNDSCKKGWFEYKFLGTGLQIHIPTSSRTDSAAVLLDNELLKLDENGGFEAHDLVDGEHRFVYGIGDATTTPVFDYLTITAGPSTLLKGRTLVVDDAEGSLVYGGNWVSNDPKPEYFDYSTTLFRDTVHWSSSVGDTIGFNFIGSSIAVYGLAANITSGNITASYTIDGVTSTHSIPRGTFDSVPMTEFFRADLQPGPHSLFINLTNIASPRRYGIDFVAYNSSVESVQDLPGFQGPVGSAATPESEDGLDPRRGLSTVQGAILGGVLGAVGFMLLIGLVFLVMRKRHPKKGVRLSSNHGSYEDITDNKSTLNSSDTRK